MLLELYMENAKWKDTRGKSFINKYWQLKIWSIVILGPSGQYLRLENRQYFIKKSDFYFGVIEVQPNKPALNLHILNIEILRWKDILCFIKSLIEVLTDINKLQIFKR